MDFTLEPLLNDPTAWAALISLVVMEIVLGIDNLIFISILTNKLPEENRGKARNLGISLALILRLALLGSIAWLIGLDQTVWDIGFHGPIDKLTGHETFETRLSWRDIILIAGGLFLVWKATKEIHHTVDHDDGKDNVVSNTLKLSLGAAIFQILLLDLVFSLDSIITAVVIGAHSAQYDLLTKRGGAMERPPHPQGTAEHPRGL